MKKNEVFITNDQVLENALTSKRVGMLLHNLMVDESCAINVWGNRLENLIWPESVRRFTKVYDF